MVGRVRVSVTRSRSARAPFANKEAVDHGFSSVARSRSTTAFGASRGRGQPRGYFPIELSFFAKTCFSICPGGLFPNKPLADPCCVTANLTRSTSAFVAVRRWAWCGTLRLPADRATAEIQHVCEVSAGLVFEFSIFLFLSSQKFTFGFQHQLGHFLTPELAG